MALDFYTASLDLPRQRGFVALPYTPYRCYHVFLNSNALTNTRQSRLLYAMFMNLELNGFPGIGSLECTAVLHHVVVAHDAPFCIRHGADPAHTAAIAADTDIALDFEGVSGSHAREIFELSQRCTRWIAEFIVCHTVKPLKAANISSYFGSVGMQMNIPTGFVLLIDFLASSLPDLIQQPNAITNVRQSTWGVYHTTYSSIAQLYVSFLGAYGDIGERVLGGEQNAILVEYVEHTDRGALHRRLTMITLAKIGLGLRVARGLPEDVYSIERAIQSIPIGLRTAWQAGFTRLLAIRTNIEGLDQLVEEDEVIERTGLNA